MAKTRRSYWLSAGGGMGVIIPFFTFTLIGLAIVTYPPFNWFNNALSDLGVVPGITSLLFNYGLFATGLMSLAFSIGLYKHLNRHFTGKIGAVVFFAAGLALEGIAIAPENRPPFHYLFSVAFFSLVPISLLIIATYFFIVCQRPLSAFTLLIAVVAAVPWIAYFTIHYVPNVAIPEIISAFAASVWAVVIGLRMFKAGNKMYKENSPIANE